MMHEYSLADHLLRLVALLSADLGLVSYFRRSLWRFFPRTGKNLAVGMEIVLKLVLGRTLLVTEQFLLASSDWITILPCLHSGSCWFLGGAPRITA